MTGGASTDPATGLPVAAHTYWSVQCLRGLAATMVVIGHSQSMVAAARPDMAFARSTALPWGAGVDLFFVISGFVMVHASRRLFGAAGARTAFLARRLARIVPLYWLASLLMLALLVAGAAKGGDRLPSALAVLATFAFVPFDTWGDGRLFPLVDLGWTLEYELFFYVVLALFVAWPRRRALAGAGLVLVALTLVGPGVAPGSAAWFWTRPILIDFALGLLVGAAAAEGIALATSWRVALALAALIVFAADPSRLFVVAPGGTVANEWPRVIWAGLPCAAFIAAATLGSEPTRPRLLAAVQAIGDASYSLYLLHPFVLIVLAKLMQKSVVVDGLAGAVLVPVAVGTAILVALASFRAVERPVTAWLTLHLRAARPHAIAPTVRKHPA